MFGQLCVFILTVNERSELPVKTKKIQHDPTHTIQCSLTKAVTQVAARNLWSLPDPGVCKPFYIVNFVKLINFGAQSSEGKFGAIQLPATIFKCCPVCVISDLKQKL